MGKQKGDKCYTEATKRQAMHLWATGQYRSDVEIAKAVGVKRWQTITDWRQKKKPEDWAAFRARIVGKTEQRAEKELVETLAGVTARQLRQVRAAQTRLLQDMRTGKAATAAQTATALAKLQEEERQLMGAPGRTDEVITSELTRDELEERIAQRLAEIRRADAAGAGRADEDGAGEAPAPRSDDPALLD